ncbi:MAG: hypothetical protein D8M58_04430 [Calditrichaeota bacterium]|nr:MAG: hypothetical protein DWQ03_02645 [Calditrichota bacterium]MBL1204617.1 hypothetical protein [Calditrichota bacterium]NOG44446.1 hypothetical protein [Calditrichota bacterium]
MIDLFKKFQDVIKALNKRNVDYILIGGYAVILYGMPRLTQDLDLIIKMDHSNIKNFRYALEDVFKDDEIKEITFDELKKYAVIRYGCPDGFYIDVMAGIGEVADYDSINFETKVFKGSFVKIATPEALFELKKNTVRPEDKRDARFLKSLIEKGG